MGTLVPVLLCLTLLLGSTVPEETDIRPNYLTFQFTARSRSTEGSPSFQTNVYLNDLAFFHYNSKSRHAKPLRPWSDMKGTGNWREETRIQIDKEKFFMGMLEEIMDYYNDRGSHTLQGLLICDVWNNTKNGLLWKYGYDGQDFMEFITTYPEWYVMDPAAEPIKKKWEEIEGNTKQTLEYLEEECPKMLQRYLEHSSSPLDQQDPPSVLLTSHVVAGENRTLKCLAYGFYPPDMDLRWTLAGEAQESQSWGDSLPSGDGTYQMWVVIEVPIQGRGPYSCQVEHSSLAEPLTVQWDEAQKAPG
ncbi:zinc-alpha-2-glycoprotein-like [Tamandua tetradactyla]|uniref:zinc-alpha-2-glycoprotein-like n=1 Tax=Tamandua tetradactyla TaxID=48850 RepID=UPI004053F4B1